MISSLKIICGMTLPVLLLAGCAVNQENSSPSQSAQMSNAGNTALRASQVSQPAGWDEDLAMAIPVDINPDPDILEINLEAKITDMEIIEGKITPVWTYGGSLPGPMIRAKVGDRLIIISAITCLIPPAFTGMACGCPTIWTGFPGLPRIQYQPVANLPMTLY